MKQLTTLEIFSGTKSFSKVMEAHGHITHTVDIDPRLDPDEVADIRKWEPVFVNACDILWASPPCQGFSVAVIGRNWNHDYTPKTDSARLSMELAQVTLDLIEEIRPKWWFIENPRAMLRKMPWMEEFLWKQGGVRHTVTYCKYGDTRMKPTDIWTNALWWKPRPHCGNGDTCHVSAPRGSRTGTQGIKGARDRGVIPPAIFEEILEQMPVIHSDPSPTSGSSV